MLRLPGQEADVRRTDKTKIDDDGWEDEPGDDDSDDSRVAGSSHYSAESYEGDDDEYDEFGGAPRL